jgi:Spy/CpxP family protein refolding chaperone
MKSKILIAVTAAALALSAAPAANAGKAKPHKHGSHKSHHVKGWKSCKAPYNYLTGGKCLDARDKKSK